MHLSCSLEFLRVSREYDNWIKGPARSTCFLLLPCHFQGSVHLTMPLLFYLVRM